MCYFKLCTCTRLKIILIWKKFLCTITINSTLSWITTVTTCSMKKCSNFSERISSTALVNILHCFSSSLISATIGNVLYLIWLSQIYNNTNQSNAKNEILYIRKLWWREGLTNLTNLGQIVKLKPSNIKLQYISNISAIIILL